MHPTWSGKPRKQSTQNEDDVPPIPERLGWRNPTCGCIMTRYSASGGHAGGWAGGGGPGRGGPSVRFFLPMKAKLGCAMPPQLAKPQKRTAMVKSALPPAPSLWLTRSLPSFLPSFLLRFSQRSVRNPFLTSILDLWRCGHAQNFQHDFDADGSHEVRGYRAPFGSFGCRYWLIDCTAAVVVLLFLLFLFCSPPLPHTYHPLLVLSRFFVQQWVCFQHWVLDASPFFLRGRGLLAIYPFASFSVLWDCTVWE